MFKIGCEPKKKAWIIRALCFHHFQKAEPIAFLDRRVCEKCGQEQRYLIGMGTASKGWINT